MAEQSIPNGIYAAALVPLKDDLSCDFKELKAHCDDLIERGCHGIALFGTTGEGASFSVSERIEALQRLVASGFDPAKIILANGGSCLPDTVALTRAALDCGCAAVLIVPPCFYKNVSEKGVIAFYREVIRQTADPRLKVILYHIPQNSGVPITLNVIESLLKEFPDIVVGLKESEGTLSYAKEVMEKFPELQVFVGNEKQIVEAVRYGGAGSICGIANLYPELIVSLYQEGSPAQEQEIDNVFQALKGYPFIPAAKSVMEMRRGGNWRAVRPPLSALAAEETIPLSSSIIFEVKK